MEQTTRVSHQQRTFAKYPKAIKLPEVPLAAACPRCGRQVKLKSQEAEILSESLADDGIVTHAGMVRRGVARCERGHVVFRVDQPPLEFDLFVKGHHSRGPRKLVVYPNGRSSQKS